MGLIGVNTGVGRFLGSGIAQDASMGPRMRLQPEYYSFAYVLEGTGNYRNTSGYKSALEPGSMIINFPDLAHNYGSVAGGHWTQIWFTFDKSVFAPWHACGILDPSRPVRHIAPVDHWFKRFKAIYEAINANRRGYPMLTLVRFQEILLEALDAEGLDATYQHDLAWADQVCEMLGDDTSRNKSLQVISEGAGLSYETFRKRFTQIVGMSPQQYRNRVLIERACRLMQETHLNNKEIAYRLGFYDEFHFSRRFKQVVGRSPKEFRRTLPLNTRPVGKGDDAEFVAALKKRSSGRGGGRGPS